jgi:hypothetical protein
MKLALTKITQDRSLQRRWALTDAEPVKSFLPPYTEFVPADLRICWSAEAGQPVEDHTLQIYAWPADRDNHLSAHWTDGYNQAAMPEWIRELSDAVHEDLIANARTNTGAEDRWEYSVSRKWAVEDAAPVHATRYAQEPFVPAELDIWHTMSPVDTRNDRHRIIAHPADRSHGSRAFADWGGGVFYDGRPRYNGDLPAWIRDLAEEQRGQLVAFATQSEAERGNR